MIPDNLRAFVEEFDPRLAELLTPGDDVPAELVQAVRYSALAPGKRVRPYLLVRCCELVGGERSDAWVPAAAIECMHSFSLIHDDLPAIDDDDLRRGRPTCHRQFGEAAAVLAGDALVLLAFELLSTRVPDRALAAGLVAELARGAGWQGMIGGEAADVFGEGQPPALETTRFIHERKTARLFEAACRMGAIAGGGASDVVDRLGHFGRALGCAFQIVDDLLDIGSTEAALGKRVGKDAKAGKQTYPRCVGEEASAEAARQFATEAREYLAPWRDKAGDLESLLSYVVDRNY